MLIEKFRFQDAEGGAEGGASGGGASGGEGGQQQQPAFYETIQDETLRTWVQGKGFQGPEAAIKSAFHAEKMLGAPSDELVRLPKDATPEAIRTVMARLGLPESADKYEIPVPDGLPVDEAFQGWARSTFHKLGLPASMAKALVEEWNGFAKSTLEAQQTDLQARLTADEEALKKEWGNGHDRKMLVATNAAQKLGFTKEMLDSMEATMGYAATMKFMADLGGKLGEDTFVGAGANSGGFGNQMTPAEAKTAYANLLSDNEFVNALTNANNPGHKAAVEKKSRLFAIAYPEQK